MVLGTCMTYVGVHFDVANCPTVHVCLFTHIQLSCVFIFKLNLRASQAHCRV